MKSKIILAAGALGAVLTAPGAMAQSFILDTGTPNGSSDLVLSSSNYYAAEFSVSSATTVTSLSAYLMGSGSSVSGTTNYVWDIYSGAINVPNSERDLVGSQSVVWTGTNGTGAWQTTTLNTPVNLAAGTYWVALEISSSGASQNLDLETAGTAVGTAPALGFDHSSGGSGAFAAASADAFGVQVTAVPLPAAAWLLLSGLGGLGALARRRRAASLG
jgi:hypothetical protein